MNQTYITSLITALILVMGLSTAFAADDAMQLTMTVEEEVEVIDAQGKRSLKRVPAESVIPGDTIVYSTSYHYSGEQAADNVVITNIIPKEVTFLPGSAAGSQTITFSIDGGKHTTAKKTSPSPRQTVSPVPPRQKITPIFAGCSPLSQVARPATSVS